MTLAAPRRSTQTAIWRRVPAATAALCALLLAAAVLLLYTGRHLTFFYDEWAFVLLRRGGGLSTYLDPHNGHLALFPVVVYKVLFAIFGLRHYTPYRVVGIALHLLCATLLYVLVRRRVGPWLALVPVALLLFMGTAWQDLLWPFQISYLASVAGGLGALALIESDARHRDAFATGLLLWSLISSGVGIAFLVANAVALIASRQLWRRLWIVAVPAAVYAAWYLGWGSSEPITSGGVLAAPQYVANAAAGAALGIAGLTDASWGPALAIALAALIAIAWRRQGRDRPTPMLLAAGAGALTFWVLAALVRADSPDPTASRYLYVGAVFIFLLAAESGVGRGLRGTSLALAGLVVLGALIGNVGVLRDGERGLRADDANVRASLRIVEIAAPVVAPTFVPSPIDAPVVTAGPYLAAVRDLGSPALTTGELDRAPTPIRMDSDRVLQLAERLTPVLAPPTAISGRRPLIIEATASGRTVAVGPCRRFIPTHPGASLALSVSPGSRLAIHVGRLPAGLYARRFGPGFPSAPLAAVSADRDMLVSFPRDLAPLLPWHVLLIASTPAEVCLT